MRNGFIVDRARTVMVWNIAPPLAFGLFGHTLMHAMGIFEITHKNWLNRL